MFTPGSRRYSESKEIKRQLFHLISISLWAVPVLYLPKWVVLTLMLCVVLVNYLLVIRVGVLVRVFKPLLYHLEREENITRPGLQSLYANIGVLLSYVVFGKLSVFGILTLAVGDSVATLVGRVLGRSKLFFNPSKSWEGTLSFFISVYAVLIPFLDVKEALAVSILSSLLEASETGLDDNLTVPLLSSGVVYLM